MNAQSEFEEWAQEAEKELMDPSTPNPRSGVIMIRLFRRWHAMEFEPHNRREEAFRDKIDRYIWGARLLLVVLMAMGGIIAWALNTISDVIALYQIGGNGP